MECANERLMVAAEVIASCARYVFRWTCSGLGESDYDVFGSPDVTKLRLRYEATDYQRSISSYDEAAWQRDVVGAIDLLHATGGGGHVTQDMVDAFNAWRLAEYMAHRRSIDAQPERYGVIDWASDPVFKRPRVVRGARYAVRVRRPDMGRDWWKVGCDGLGWVILGQPAPEGETDLTKLR
jgi:hypothetical protein